MRGGRYAVEVIVSLKRRTTLDASTRGILARVLLVSDEINGFGKLCYGLSFG